MGQLPWPSHATSRTSQKTQSSRLLVHKHVPRVVCEGRGKSFPVGLVLRYPLNFVDSAVSVRYWNHACLSLKCLFFTTLLVSEQQTDLKNEFSVKNCPYSLLVAWFWTFLSHIWCPQKLGTTKAPRMVNWTTFLKKQTLLRVHFCRIEAKSLDSLHMSQTMRELR